MSPVIFGSLFQNVKERGERRQQGEHYTSEGDILKVVDELFMDELRLEYKRCRGVKKELNRLHRKIANLRFLDPACGCGNFLCVAYRELRRLETRILVDQATMKGLPGCEVDRCGPHRVTMDQLHGIEIEELPARLAQAAMNLVDHQENMALSMELGQHSARFPIEAEARIEVGNALEMPWAEVLHPDEADYVLGNPPFGGHRYRSKEQSAELKRVWGGAYNKLLDYVTGWYRIAADYGRGRRVKFAFVSTNSISQGEQVARLWGPLYRAGYHIDFAHRTFPWDSDARGKAQVHVVIEGFSHGDERSTARRLHYYRGGSTASAEVEIEAGTISPYLVPGPEIVVTKSWEPLTGVLPTVSYGSLPADGGGLVVTPEARGEVDAVAEAYLRRYVGSRELVNNIDRWCLWMPEGPRPGDLKKSAFLEERLERVRSSREASKNPDTRELAQEPYRFFHVSVPTENYIAFPAQVSNSRRWYTVDFLDPDVVPSNTLYWALDPEGIALAIMSSSMFMIWLRTVGGRIKSDPRFGKAAYNAFPVPAPRDGQRGDLIRDARALLQAREDSGARSLAELYQSTATPRGVVTAHRRIDRTVDRMFGLEGRGITDEGRLMELLARYSELQ